MNRDHSHVPSLEMTRCCRDVGVKFLARPNPSWPRSGPTAPPLQDVGHLHHTPSSRRHVGRCQPAALLSKKNVLTLASLSSGRGRSTATRALSGDVHDDGEIDKGRDVGWTRGGRQRAPGVPLHGRTGSGGATACRAPNKGKQCPQSFFFCGHPV
jgi:hypothetical protein